MVNCNHCSSTPLKANFLFTVTFSPDGACLAISSNSASNADSGEITVFNVANGTLTQENQYYLPKKYSPYAIAFSQDNSYFAATHLPFSHIPHNDIILFSVDGCKLTNATSYTLPNNATSASSLSFFFNGKCLAVAIENGTVAFNVTSDGLDEGTLYKIGQPTQPCSLDTIAFSSNGYFATVNSDDGITLASTDCSNTNP